MVWTKDVLLIRSLLVSLAVCDPWAPKFAEIHQITMSNE